MIEIVLFWFSVVMFIALLHITYGIWYKSKRTPALTLFFVMGLIHSFWTLFNGVGLLLAQNVFEKIYPVYFTSACFLPTIYLWYILYFTGSKLAGKKWTPLVMSSIMAADLLLLLTNPWHQNLIAGYDGMRPIAGTLFPLHAILGYTPLFTGIVLLTIYIFKNIKKIKALAYVGFGVFLTVISNILYTFGVIDFGFDITPFTFIIMFGGFAMYSAQIKQFELKESEEIKFQLAKLNLIIEAAKIGMVNMELDQDDPLSPDNHTEYSDEYKKLLGFTEDDMSPESLGESRIGLVHPDDLDSSFKAFSDHILDKTGKTPFDIEQRLKKKSGEYAWFRTVGKAIRDNDGTPIRFVNAAFDMTETKNLINEAERLRQQAEEANEAKTIFLANMSHEIRTPLNAVIGLSNLILDTDNGLNDESRYRLDRINNAGATLLSMVNDILDISKIEAGKFELIPTTYDTPVMINDAVTQSILHKGEKPIEFIMNVCADMPAQLYGDELRIKQILNNFLSNAFKYTTKGTVELTVNNVREGDAVWLTFIIRDTGIGIKQEDMKKLFGDYVQIDMSANRKIVGTGLGLSIAKRLVELMNGNITAESEFGKGSVFTVSLMQGYVTGDVIGTEVLENLKEMKYSENNRQKFDNASRISLPYARVLVVDDVITNLDVAKGIMKPYNMEIDCVTSGPEAIEAMQDSSVRYNAIFMDHMMPGMDGIEATRLIREIGTDYAKKIPVIALTANAILGNEEMFLSNGFQAFISKPIEITHLDAVICEWIRDREQEKQYRDADEPDLNAINEDKNWLALDKGITGIDVKKGILRFNGDKDAYIDVLRSYAKNTPPLLEAAAGVSEDRLADYATIVHGIKGSSGGIIAEETAGLASALEKAANAGDYSFITANNVKLIETAQMVISGILSTIAEIDESNIKPVKSKPDAKTLDRLYQACTNYDMNGVDSALEELESFDYESDGALVDWLRENVELMNFDEIIEKLSH